MEKIIRIAAFTGSPEAEKAISERIESTSDYIEDNGLQLPDRSDPPDGWPCAIFRPEASMYGWALDSSGSGCLEDEAACRAYNLPVGTQSAVFVILEGEDGQLEGFCQAVCDLSGMQCHVIMDTDDGYELDRTLAPANGPVDAQSFISLLFDEPEW